LKSGTPAAPDLGDKTTPTAGADGDTQARTPDRAAGADADTQARAPDRAAGADADTEARAPDRAAGADADTEATAAVETDNKPTAAVEWPEIVGLSCRFGR